MHQWSITYLRSCRFRGMREVKMTLPGRLSEQQVRITVDKRLSAMRNNGIQVHLSYDLVKELAA